MGIIQVLCLVKIEGIKILIGFIVGVGVGGVVGSVVGGGKGSYVVVIIGVVVGGLLGVVIEEGLMCIQGVEIIVCEDDGSICVYVQQVDQGQIFCVGECVCILIVNGISCVVY